MKDTVLQEKEDQEHYGNATSWANIMPPFLLKRDDFDTLKLWAEIQREGGGGTVELRIQLTDGVLTYNSTAATTTLTAWDDTNFPVSIDMSAIEDKVWTCNIQHQVPADTAMAARNISVRRES